MIRLFWIGGAVALFGAVLLGGSMLPGARSSHADIIAGQYSLEVSSPSTSVAVGAQFTANIGIYHSAPSYQGVSWHVAYDSAVISVVSINKAAAAPSECSLQAYSPSRVLLGCVNLSSPSISYSGNAFQVVFQCKGNGTTSLSIPTTSPGETFVAIDTDPNHNQPIHTHGASIQCGAGGPPPPPPPPGSELCTIQKVLTGDSFTCANGKTVRMLQIDAQNLDQCGGGWAKAALANIFLPVGRVVTLDFDAKKTDAAGNALAAPIARGTDGADYNLSIVMVYVGLAKAADFGDGNVKFLAWANASQVWASAAKWNMWAPNKTYTGGCD